MPTKKGNIFTRKIGPFPGYVWALGAGGLGLLYFFMAGRSNQQAAASGPQGSAVNNPAASSTVPYVPSVVVTGLGPNTGAGTATGTTPVSTAPAGGPIGIGSLLQVTASPYMQGPDGSGGTVLRNTPTAPGGVWVRVGTILTMAGTPQVVQNQGLGSITMTPVTYLGGKYWVSTGDIAPGPGAGQGGGAGGPGPSGMGVPLVTSMMGWTSGWSAPGSSGGWPLMPGPRGRGDVAASDGGGAGGGAISKVVGRPRGGLRQRPQRRIGSR